MSAVQASAQLAPLLEVALRSCTSASERNTAMWVHGKLALEASYTRGLALQLPSAPSVPFAFDIASVSSGDDTGEAVMTLVGRITDVEQKVVAL